MFVSDQRMPVQGKAVEKAQEAHGTDRLLVRFLWLTMG